MRGREKRLLNTGYQLLETASGRAAIQHPIAVILDKLWIIHRKSQNTINLDLYQIVINSNDIYYSFTITSDGEKALEYVFSHHGQKIYFFKRDPDNMEKDFMFYAKLLIEA